MRILGAAVLVAAIMGLIPVASLADRAHDLAKNASKVAVELCDPDVISFRVCHLNYPAGCTHRGSYDAYLNYLKNQAPPPDSAITRTLTVSDFRTLEKNLPGTLRRGNHGPHADDLANLGEGNIAAVIGYLYYSEVTGRETTNCQLTGPNDVDYHIGIGFDAVAAATLRGHPATGRSIPVPLQQSSIVVEMTPHYRAQYHPKWTNPLVQRYVGRQVKVVGQMLVDNEHLVTKDDCAFPGANMHSCWRASVWELHPVIQFFICTAAVACDAQSANWVRIDDEP